MTSSPKPSFPLLKLPFLALDVIIKQMKIGEIMRMAICSKRVYRLVKLGKLRIKDVNVHVKTGDLQIEVNRTSEDYCDFYFNSPEHREWFQERNSAVLNFRTGSFHDFLTVSNRLRSDFRVKQFCWKLYPEKLQNCDIKALISTIDFDQSYAVCVLDGVLDTESLSFLIDRIANSEMRIGIASEIPSDFKHPRAFEFARAEYEDARWVSVEDLKGIRNNRSVQLTELTNFDNNDINELIKYWTECEEMMFSQIKIRLRDGVEIDELAIVNGVIFMFSEGYQRYYLISKEQNHSVLSVEFVDGIVILETWFFDTFPADTITVLQLLELRCDLSTSYSELIKKERELYARLESVEDGGEENDLDQEILKIEAEKKNVEIKFYETVHKLEDLDIYNFETSLEPDF